MVGTHEENLELFDDAQQELSQQLLEHLPDIPVEVRRKWPRDLVQIIDIYGAALSRLGVSETDADRISHALIAELANYCGGRHIYLPKADSIKKAIRDVMLYRQWRYENASIETLAIRYGFSVNQVYRVLRQQQAYQRSREQPDLFREAKE